MSQDLHISLVDKGCNGEFLRENAKILSIKESSFADIIGMNNSLVNQAPIGTGALKINTTNGPIIGIFNQYTTGGKGHTIHSALQMEAYGLKVEEKSRLVPNVQSRQVIETPEGHIIPLSIQGGLAYMESSYPTDQDLETYPHVYMTSDCEWDPTVFDNSHDDSIYDSINFQNSQNNQEDNQNSHYDLFSSAWEYNDIDLGDFYQYDDPNIYICIRDAHLVAKGTLSSSLILNLYQPQKYFLRNQILRKL